MALIRWQRGNELNAEQRKGTIEVMKKKKTRNDCLRAFLSFMENDFAVIAVLFIVLVMLGALGVTVSWLVAIIAAVLFIIFIWLMRIVIIPGLMKVVTGQEGIIGSQGRVVSPLTPRGVVLLEGERWNARSANGDIQTDEEVEVTGVERLVLVVRRLKKE